MHRDKNDIKDFKDKCTLYCQQFDDKEFNSIVDGHYDEFFQIALFIKSI